MAKRFEKEEVEVVEAAGWKKRKAEFAVRERRPEGAKREKD